MCILYTLILPGHCNIEGIERANKVTKPARSFPDTLFITLSSPITT